MVEPMRAILLRQSCWGAGQCGARGPVICGAGLTAWSSSGRAGCLCRVHRALLLIFGGIHPNCAAVFAIGQERFSGYIERIGREVGLRWRPEVLINSIFPAP